MHGLWSSAADSRLAGDRRGIAVICPQVSPWIIEGREAPKIGLDGVADGDSGFLPEFASENRGAAKMANCGFCGKTSDIQLGVAREDTSTFSPPPRVPVPLSGVQVPFFNNDTVFGDSEND